MFNGKKNPQISSEGVPSSKADTTIIGSSSSFEGKLNSSGIVRIDGAFDGEMNVEGSLIIGDGGSIKGNARAKKVTIAGKVEGNIHCDGALELTPSGRLLGDIEVRSINIEEGAVFQGKCTMIESAPMLEPADEADIKLLSKSDKILSD